MKHRAVRVGEVIQRELSDLLQKKIKDPRLTSVMVTGVDMTGDLSLARVYIRSLGDSVNQKEVMKGLESAKGYLRRELAPRLDLKKAPEILFFYDTTLDYALHIEKLLKSLDTPKS